MLKFADVGYEKQKNLKNCKKKRDRPNLSYVSDIVVSKLVMTLCNHQQPFWCFFANNRIITLNLLWPCDKLSYNFSGVIIFYYHYTGGCKDVYFRTILVSTVDDKIVNYMTLADAVINKVFSADALSYIMLACCHIEFSSLKNFPLVFFNYT